jgi:hypothetical protein
MSGQLGQVTLDVAEGDALASLVGVLEQVGGQQLGTLDHTHGTVRRPGVTTCNQVRTTGVPVRMSTCVGRPLAVRSRTSASLQ